MTKERKLKLFESRKNDDYTIIIGCSSLGASIANSLSDEGKNVLIMDEVKGSFRRLASNFGGLSVIGNGTDMDKLREAQIERADAVIAVTNDDNINIMIAQIAKSIFGVRHVIARLYDPECEDVYRKLGIDTICPSVLSAKEIDKLLQNAFGKEVLL